MYPEQDLESLFEFLRHTGEGNLKKMMVSGAMTEAHLRLLLKIARNVQSPEFVSCAQSDTFPKLKMNAPEHFLRETFWKTALDACAGVGLIAKAKHVA